MTFLSRLAVEHYGPKTWRLLEDLTYRGATDLYTVPAGYVTDFATVPDFLVWVINKTGPYTRAAVVHDWLITDEIPAKRVTSQDTDGIFRRIMREEGTPLVRRWVMWAAVRLASLGNTRRAYGRHFVRDAPRVLGILLLAAPLLAPASLMVLITRVIFAPLRYLK